MPQTLNGITTSKQSVNNLLTKFDWKKTSLGDIDSWPLALQTSLSICIDSNFPVLILWGEDYVQIYNDAYSKIIGKKHPADFGTSAKRTWQKANWTEMAPLLESVLHDGKSFLIEDHKFTSIKDGSPEERYYTVSYSPIYGGIRKPEGIFITVFDRTKDVQPKNNFPEIKNRQFEELLIHSPLGLTVLRGDDMTIEIANHKILELWGKKSQDVLNKPLFDVLPDARGQGFEELLQRVYSKGERVVLDETPLTLVRNGLKEELFVKLIYEPLRDVKGNITGVLALADDITLQIAARKMTEESETRMKLAIEAADIGTFDWNMKTSSFQYTERLAKIFGYANNSELTQDSFSKLIHPDDKALRHAAHRDALKSGKLFYEARFVWPDFSTHWIRVNGKIVYDKDGTPSRMFGTAFDFTKQKEHADSLEQLVEERTHHLRVRNEELKQSEERYHRMVEEVQNYAIILLDRDGIIQNWNKGAEKIKGYRDFEILGKHFSVFYTPEDLKRGWPFTLLAEARKNGKALDEGFRVKKDGSWFWGSITITALHDSTGEVIGFSKVTRDLTEKKIAEDQLQEFTAELKAANEELKKSEERYHKMIAEVQDYAIILLSPEGIVQNWNAGAEFIKGYKASEIVGKSFEMFYTPTDRQNNLPLTLLNQAKLTGKATQEGWRVRKDGSKFWGSIVITALHNNEGRIIGYSKVTRDLTERKEAEDKLKVYMRELESQNRELEQFAYIASHDLQEPLRKIQTFTEILQRHINSDDVATRYFDKISTSAKRMSELIKSVLNYSRLTKDQDQAIEIDLNTILENVVSDYELTIAEKNAIIHYNSLPVVKGSALQMNQLFSNLISNALKFSSANPVIKISANIVSDKNVVQRPENLRPGKYWEIVMEDNGIGFEQQYAVQIFSMFQRLHGKQTYSGTGIGLALCKKIAELHNGHIAAVSEPGKGSKFFLYIPK
jgi:PAS domain S-box-containing protein